MVASKRVTWTAWNQAPEGLSVTTMAVLCFECASGVGIIFEADEFLHCVYQDIKQNP